MVPGCAPRAGRQSEEKLLCLESDQPEISETRIIFTRYRNFQLDLGLYGQAYYWHRFFITNQILITIILKWSKPYPGHGFWLDMGVDGLRLDAVPYLCVREGTE